MTLETPMKIHDVEITHIGFDAGGVFRIKGETKDEGFRELRFTYGEFIKMQQFFDRQPTGGE